MGTVTVKTMWPVAVAIGLLFSSRLCAVEACAVGKELAFPVDSKQIGAFLDRDDVKKTADPIDTLLCCLPKRLRRDPVYMKKSRSSQPGTPESPRVILTDDERGASPPILAFNATSGTLEMIERGAKGAMSFVGFRPNGKGAGHLDGNRCQGCHRGRGIWDTYFVWRGAYGAFDGQAVDEKERKEWTSFVGGMAKRPRYRCLEESGDISGRGIERNGRPGFVLFTHNVDRVAGELAENRSLTRYRAAMLAAVLCRNPGEAHPITKAVHGAPFVDLSADASKKVLEFAKELERKGPLAYLPAALAKKLGVTDKTIPDLEKAIQKKAARDVLGRFEGMDPKAAGVTMTDRTKDLLKKDVSDGYASLENWSLRSLARLLFLTKVVARNDVMAGWTMVADDATLKARADDAEPPDALSAPLSFNDGSTQDFGMQVMTRVAPAWSRELGIPFTGVTAEYCESLLEASQRILGAGTTTAFEAPAGEPAHRF